MRCAGLGSIWLRSASVFIQTKLATSATVAKKRNALKCFAILRALLWRSTSSDQTKRNKYSSMIFDTESKNQMNFTQAWNEIQTNHCLYAPVNSLPIFGLIIFHFMVCHLSSLFESKIYLCDQLFMIQIVRCARITQCICDCVQIGTRWYQCRCASAILLALSRWLVDCIRVSPVIIIMCSVQRAGWITLIGPVW